MTTKDEPMDHVPSDAMADDDEGSSDLEKNVKDKSTWVRLFFMVVLAFLYGLSRFVVGAVVVIQFFYVLLTGQTKDELKSFGHSLAIYSYEVIDYLTFNTDEKPFPFDGDWPTSLPDD
jgi:hypothetical protein